MRREKDWIFILMAISLLSRGYNNAYYAKVGGVSTAEMNSLELKFLLSLEFRLHVTPEMFSEYCLEKEGGGKQIERLIPVYG
ncbi:hypothetical protein L1049_019911 [Liquidambar formosana]|uniref:Cyclin n=1 Tax=Liquidambar formosana TaxID=63359 RepID=A0AAP0SAI3_LIQFO